jgi:hypothetical protein
MAQTSEPKSGLFQVAFEGRLARWHRTRWITEIQVGFAYRTAPYIAGCRSNAKAAGGYFSRLELFVS